MSLLFWGMFVVWLLSKSVAKILLFIHICKSRRIFFVHLPALFFTQGTFTTHLRLFQHSFTTLSAHPNCAFFVFFLLISKKSSTFAPDLAHTANDR